MHHSERKISDETFNIKKYQYFDFRYEFVTKTNTKKCRNLFT